MKQVLISFSLFSMLAFLSCSESPNSPMQKSDPGSANVSIVIGKVGSLGKIRSIELSKLYIKLSAPGETSIMDSADLSGNAGGTIVKTYSSLASLFKTWTLTAESRDIAGAVIHSGSTQFIVPANNSIPVALNLGSKYSMLKANFFPIRDSVTRCELLVNNVKQDDTLFVKQTILGDTVKLSYNYLDVGVAQKIKLDVYGTMWGFDTLLYTGDTQITPTEGAKENYSITLKWVGPVLPPPGQASMSVVLGTIGTITINGTLGINYSDDFESVNLNPFWQKVEKFGTVTFANIPTHSGGQSIKCSAVSGGDRWLYLFHGFDQPVVNAKISVWMYDAFAGSNGLNAYLGIFNTAVPGTSPSFGIGIGAQDFDPFHYYAGSGSFTPDQLTSVSRTIGWHKFDIQCSANLQKYYIDNILVREEVMPYVGFNEIRLSLFGPSWRPNVDVYFDDFELTIN